MSGTIRSTNGDLLYVSREHLGSIMGIASSIALGVSKIQGAIKRMNVRPFKCDKFVIVNNV